MRPRKGRSGYTMIEVAVAVTILSLLIPVIAQLAYWSLMQRMRAQSEQAALELCQNILESARAAKFEDLTDRWAAAQTIPSDTKTLLPDAKLSVKIEPDVNQVRRVTVAVTWHTEPGGPAREVQLVTLLSPRSLVVSSGGKE